MYSQPELITPVTARAILDHKNPHNRPISRAQATTAASSVRTGRFTRSVALVRAPDETAALRIALAGHADHYQDLHVAAELADLP